MRKAVATTFGLMVSLVPVFAHADSSAPANVVSLGYLRTWVFGDAAVTSHGIEVTYMHYPLASELLAYSGLVQFETYGGAYRIAGGGQLSFGVVGLEAALAHRGADATHAATLGIHLAPYLSVGFLHLALRVVAPISGDPGYPTEVGLTLGLKVPVPIDRLPELLRIRVPAGRPLRADDGTQWLPEVLLAEQGALAQPRLGDASTRRAAATRFVADGQLECAAIACFLRLAEELRALSADPALIEGALAAAEDEVRHTELCFALASAYAGVPLAPVPRPAVEPRAIDWATLAVESFVDGCCGEGLAAEAAREEAARTDDPVVRAALAILAEDEARHAELAWRIVTFCRRIAPVDGALEAAIADLHREGPSLAARVRRDAVRRLRDSH